MLKVIAEWMDISDYDFETAEAVLKSGQYLYVVFMCQQGVEKLLKAVYCKQLKEMPVRTHNLLYLLDKVTINETDINREFLGRLNQFYLESRYPGERASLARSLSKQTAQVYLEQAQEVRACSKQLLI
jgi:HEPN domain-containing protein